MENPVRGFLHGSAAVVSVAGLVALVSRTDEPRSTVAGVVYGLTLTLMYVTSALYHSVPWSARTKVRLQKVDHAFIYALVAATFTLMAVGVAEGPWVAIGLSGVWGLLVLGVGRELSGARIRSILLALQAVAVVLTLPGLWLTLTRMDPATAVLTVLGGGWYLIGVLLFVTGRPQLAPRFFSHHEFFHVMVIVASAFHFVAVWRVVAS
jgi:hemolysin III